MTRGWVGGVLVLCILAVGFAVSGLEGSVFVGGRPVTLVSKPVWKGTDLLVPLAEFGLLLGIETSCTADDSAFLARSHSGKCLIDSADLESIDQILYIELEELAALVEATVHYIGKEVYVEAEPSCLFSIETSSEQMTARFDAFTPHVLVKKEPNEIHYRFHHCSLSAAPRRFTTTGGPIVSVELWTGPAGCVDLVIKVVADSPSQARYFQAPDFYSVTLQFDGREMEEKREQISENISCVEQQTDLGEGPVHIDRLQVDGWRDSFRLVPAIPESGIGTLSTLADMAEYYGAYAAVNANPYDRRTNSPRGLLIVEGVPLNYSCNCSAALGIDLLGRLAFLAPTAHLHLRYGTEMIPVDDVNRSIGTDELLVYTPGYAGPITTGISRPLRVVKVRNERIVAVQDTPYVVEDPSATLVVATGIARARLLDVVVGERINLEYRLDRGDFLVTSVISGDSLLIVDGEDVAALENGAIGLQPGPAGELGARTVLATDYYGNLNMISVSHGAGSVGASRDGLLDLLHDLPHKVKNAIAIGNGACSSLVVGDTIPHRELSSGGQVAVGLFLMPIDR